MKWQLSKYKVEFEIGVQNTKESECVFWKKYGEGCTQKAHDYWLLFKRMLAIAIPQKVGNSVYYVGNEEFSDSLLNVDPTYRDRWHWREWDVKMPT